MEINLIQTAVSTIAAILLTVSPGTTNSAPTTQKIERESPKTIEYIVKRGDSLQAIAERNYENKDYWTNIWNDNDWIKNPNLLEPDWKLTLDKDSTEKPEELKEELASKLVFEPKINSIKEGQEASTSATKEIEKQTESNEEISYIGGPLTSEQINFLGNCESGMTAGRNSGNGFYGAFQFTIGTWNSMGTGYERADLAPLEVQVEAVQRLVQRSNIFSQFPACSARMKSLGLL